jgi:hypothetical protein
VDVVEGVGGVRSGVREIGIYEVDEEFGGVGVQRELDEVRNFLECYGERMMELTVYPMLAKWSLISVMGPLYATLPFDNNMSLSKSSNVVVEG